MLWVLGRKLHSSELLEQREGGEVVLAEVGETKAQQIDVVTWEEHEQQGLAGGCKQLKALMLL